MLHMILFLMLLFYPRPIEKTCVDGDLVYSSKGRTFIQVDGCRRPFLKDPWEDRWPGRPR